jgi:hypothetical protein
MAQINVQNTKITVLDIDNKDYICLTDMAGAKENDVRAADVIKNWLRNRYTLEFLGTWETIHNPGFKVVEFDHFRKEAGLPTFVLSCSEWIEKTNAIGIVVKKGRYGGTYSRIVNEPSIDYDTSKLMQALYALNDEAHKNGTAGMSEEEIEAEIKAVRHSRASGL